MMVSDKPVKQVQGFHCVIPCLPARDEAHLMEGDPRRRQWGQTVCQELTENVYINVGREMGQ